jgi:hypothetical protein
VISTSRAAPHEVDNGVTFVPKPLSCQRVLSAVEKTPSGGLGA